MAADLVPSAPALDSLVDATPAGRDRYVDLLRALSIVVVVAWHWVFSVTQWRHGRLTMPNPVGDVPLLWAATWVLQIMPVFFFVGGYANAASWDATRRDGGRWRDFARRRLQRLYRPLAIYVGLWLAFEVVTRLAVPSYPGVLHWGEVVFVPLWFLATYTGVLLLTPLTTAVHRRHGVRAVVALGLLIVLLDVGRFGAGLASLGLVTSALVWLFAHQLGYLYRDGTLARIGRRGQAALAAGGVLALIALIHFGPYSHSMVAVGGDRVSNMFPTTACVAALAVLQAGLVMLVRPSATRLLQRRRVWRSVVAANGVAMTVFIWHMTALVAVIALAGRLGFRLPTRPTASWWFERPLWVAGPGVALAALVALFAPIEQQRPTVAHRLVARGRRSAAGGGVPRPGVDEGRRSG